MFTWLSYAAPDASSLKISFMQLAGFFLIHPKQTLIVTNSF